MLLLLKNQFFEQTQFLLAWQLYFFIKKVIQFLSHRFFDSKSQRSSFVILEQKACGHKIKAKQAQITIGLTYRQRVCKPLKISNLPGFSMITTNKMKRLNSDGQLFLNTFILFWLTNLKMFLKAPWAPKYTNFEGGARAKNRNFLVKTFQKVLKTPFLACFFSKLCLRRRKFWTK